MKREEEKYKIVGAINVEPRNRGLYVCLCENFKSVYIIKYKLSAIGRCNIFNRNIFRQFICHEIYLNFISIEIHLY